MNDDSPTPRRRWFRFGLRTMFVVLTVISVWLGWQACWIQQRRAYLEELRIGFPLAKPIWYLVAFTTRGRLHESVSHRSADFNSSRSFPCVSALAPSHNLRRLQTCL
jgi:hypothetical protein